MILQEEIIKRVQDSQKYYNYKTEYFESNVILKHTHPQVHVQKPFCLPIQIQKIKL